MLKGSEQLGFIERVDFPNRGICHIVTEGATIEERKVRFVVKGALKGQTIRFRVTKLFSAKSRGEGLLLSVEKRGL